MKWILTNLYNADDCALVKVDILRLLLLLEGLLRGLDQVVGGLPDGVRGRLQPLHAPRVGVGLDLASQQKLGGWSGNLFGRPDQLLLGRVTFDLNKEKQIWFFVSIFSIL